MFSLTFISGCTGRTRVASVGPDSAITVPAKAPDFVPAALFDSLGTVRNPANPVGFRWVRGVVAIVFKADATAAQRRDVIQTIHGRVVGGIRWLGDDGDYFVAVPARTFDDLMKTLVAVKAMPQVELVHPMIRDPNPLNGVPPF